MNRPRIKLEICTASAEDCAVAEQSGADRVELNCALMLGGLTPSLGALREARAAIRIPLIAMIRPRAGGFCYSASDFKVMQRDVEAALAEGADGIAFGILTPNGTIDLERCRQIVKLAAGRQIVFHRAFDVVPEPLTALDQLIDLGVTRVMTSGQETSAYNGAVGDSVNYWIGHTTGMKAFEKNYSLVKKEQLKKTEEYFARYGGPHYRDCTLCPLHPHICTVPCRYGRMSIPLVPDV